MLALFTMKSLYLLVLLIVLPACRVSLHSGSEGTTASYSAANSITYRVSQNLILLNEGPAAPEKHLIWVALIIDHAPYQAVLSRDIQPAHYVIVTDEYGNQYAEFDFKDLAPGERAEINISYEVTVQELMYDFEACRGDLPDEFIEPELHIESNNPQIATLAAELAGPDTSICEQVASFYNYTGDNLVYTFNGADWGAQAALGKMGADCTEYSSLLIALSRARGIPARYIEGLLYMNENSPPLARQEHAWAEVFFPGSGWAPVDPTLGRAPVTRREHFARYTPNHIIVTRGRSPSTLRGASYWSHLYWPGGSTTIRVEDGGWTIVPAE